MLSPSLRLLAALLLALAVCTADRDDPSAGVYPGADERCTGLDEDCDGNAAMGPDGTELCDGIDHDRDTLIDEAGAPVAVAPSTVYRVLLKAGRIARWAPPPTRKGKGFA